VEPHNIIPEGIMLRALSVAVGLVLAAALAVHAVSAQNPPTQSMPVQPGQMPHGEMHEAMSHGAVPALPGQDAFGAIAEVVRLLDADPGTDWSKVNLERLRQHLIDMNEVVLRSEVKQSPVPAGVVMDVTGSGRTQQAIRAMLVPHAAELGAMPGLAAKAEPITGGVRLTVTSTKPDDARAVARLRGLGFAGLLALGAHHGPHHLAMARGEAIAGHTH
jgi:hypothetical protein